MSLSDSANPYITLVPYLPLNQSVTFGGWWLGPLDQFDGPWLSEDFEAAARLLASGFVDVRAKQVRRPAVLVRESEGADGQPPTSEEYGALRLAIGFAVIHANAYWSPETKDDGWRLATTDNATVWAQPLDLADGRIALQSGSRIRTLDIGLRMTSVGFTIPPPLELHLPSGVTLDAGLLALLSTVLLKQSPEHHCLIGTLRVAIRWLLKSWQNTQSITWEDRLVFLKVATEALTGEYRNHRSAKRLVEIFTSAETQSGEGFGSKGLLWQPDEPLLTRHWIEKGQPREEYVTQFEHWACAFGDERNAIVHGRLTHKNHYEEPGSPYNGSFVDIGDRVVREAILVQLGNCGHPEMWRNPFGRAELEALQLRNEEAEETTA
jgi:hypothetical protein